MQWLERRLQGHVPCDLFGGGDSSSSSSTSTSNTDKRQVVSDYGVGVSSDSSTVNVSLTDQGAFAKAVDLARSGSDNTLQAFDSVLGLTGRTLDKLLDIQMSNQALQGAVLERSQDPESIDKNKSLLVIAVVAGAIVLVTVFGKSR